MPLLSFCSELMSSCTCAACQDSRGLVRLDLPELCCVCPVGTNCSAGGIPLETLPLKAGYYRLSDDSSDVRRCPDAAANCTYANQCPETTSGCAGGSDIASVCRPTLRGIFCTQCEADTNHTRYYTCIEPSLACSKIACACIPPVCMSH